MSLDSDQRKLVWLIGLRAVLVTVLLGSAILVELSAPGSVPSRPFFVLIGLTYALTALYAATARYAARTTWLVDLQLGGDAFVVSAIIFFTGGIGSYFSTLYVLPIIAASVVASRRASSMVALLSAVTYAGVVLAQYEWWPLGLHAMRIAGPALLPPARVAIYTVTLNVFGFLAVGALAGSLAENLRRANARLERASTEIADLQALSRHIVDSMTSGLATTDADRRIVAFNKSAEAITGHHAASILGRLIDEVLQIPPAQQPALDPAGLLRRPRGTRVDYPFIRVDGEHIDLGVSSAPLITSAGPSGLLFIFQDVTEVKKLARESLQQQRLAAVGEMAAGIAHEIRNPLGSMSGSIQVLRQELPLTAEQAQLMDIVLRESERLNQTISSFLAYARPQHLARLRIDLGQVVDDTARLLRNNAEFGDRHEITVKVPPIAVSYEADEAQMRQIVWNLATNALRAMPDGGRLSLSVVRDDNGVVLRVSDQGVGIPAEELDQIFQPFRSAFAKGTGLGLAIVHRIVTDYGGEIHVNSAPGAGTTVEIRLPGATPLRTAC
jgi:two-component system sensor histidine kinase PilS (NtrC family)